MTATIWEHWFKWYVDYTDNKGNIIKQEWFNTLDEAKSSARSWGAFVITR